MRTRFSAVILLTALAISSTAIAQARKSTQPAAPAAPAAAAAQKITSVEGITEYRLGNGLTVLLFPAPTKLAQPVNRFCLVAARSVDNGEAGMARLHEDL